MITDEQIKKVAAVMFGPRLPMETLEKLPDPSVLQEMYQPKTLEEASVDDILYGKVKLPPVRSLDGLKRLMASVLVPADK